MAGASSSGQRRWAGPGTAGQQIVGPALHQLGDEIGLAGATRMASASRAEVDVRHVVGLARIPLAQHHRLARQRLHRHRGDELAGGLGHHHLHAGAGLGEGPHQFGRSCSRRCRRTGPARCGARRWSVRPPPRRAHPVPPPAPGAPRRPTATPAAAGAALRARRAGLPGPGGWPARARAKAAPAVRWQRPRGRRRRARRRRPPGVAATRRTAPPAGPQPAPSGSRRPIPPPPGR
jgi:hypothetical protein